jgi:DNA helicase II / ATP-dependent DNA helicase PcrA
MEPSKFQKKIYQWISTGSGNAIIRAVAGSGKTTTIVEASKLLPSHKKSVFVAFNTAIVNELKGRLPNTIECKTLHSLGFNVLRQGGIQTELDQDKTFKLIMEVFEEDGITEDNDNYIEYINILKKNITKIKANNLNYKDYSVVEEQFIKDDYELNDTLFSMLNRVLDRTKKNQATIDFDDMIWLPVQLKLKPSTYDFIFVDEAQDLNKAQFELIKMISNGGTRVVAVGDEAQSMYAFRGADTNSMNNFKEYFKMDELPLSICYRCPKKVIELAQQIVPHIEAKANAIEGVVEELPDVYELVAKAQEGDLVLCRINAPLIGVAFKLIRENKKAVVRGRDIGKNLMKMITKYKAKTLNDLESKISKFLQLQNDKLMLIEQGKLDKKKKASIMAYIDECETVLAIAENVEDITELKDKIETIFSDDKVGVVCSSIHKAKGLEADVVFIIDYDKMPHPMAKTDDEKQQERNIKYVALTRAKKELYIIH